MKRMLCVLFFALLVWLQLPCCYADSQEAAGESSLAWLMDLYGYALPQNVATFAQTNFQPLTVDADGLLVSIQEILYDGVWLFTSVAVQPSSDGYIIVPFEVELNDPIAGGYGENLRDDPRTFLEAAQEDGKDLMIFSIMPAEYEQVDFYFLDHRQDAGLQSTLFSGAPVTMEGTEITIHLAVEATLISHETGEVLSESRHEYPVTMGNLGIHSTKEYLPAAEDALFEKVTLVQTDLATYMVPTWKASSIDPKLKYMLTDADGHPYPAGIPQDAASCALDTFPETLYIQFTEETGETFTATFTASP